MGKCAGGTVISGVRICTNLTFGTVNTFTTVARKRVVFTCLTCSYSGITYITRRIWSTITTVGVIITTMCRISCIGIIIIKIRNTTINRAIRTNIVDSPPTSILTRCTACQCAGYRGTFGTTGCTCIRILWTSVCANGPFARATRCASGTVAAAGRCRGLCATCTEVSRRYVAATGRSTGTVFATRACRTTAAAIGAVIPRRTRGTRRIICIIVR